MAKKYSPSVNIIRDAARELAYLPTPNACTVFGQIVNNYRSGIRCFNIVGAYGTGKSAFLWAFEQTLTGKQPFFESETTFQEDITFQFEAFVGRYGSLRETFAERFAPHVSSENLTSKAVIAGIDAHYSTLATQQKGLVLILDEFGKFLEYASKENPEDELYFIQELAEYINNYDRDIFLIATVHQDFSSYALSLSRTQRQEWEKVKGRLKELTFNEPVEQLLYLAAQQLSTQRESRVPVIDNQVLFDAISAARVFPLQDYFTTEVQQKVWPLDILSASVLVLALQKYGQNERSLFSFLESNDYLGIQDHSGDSYYGVSNVYDYLIYHYYSLLTSRYNPHHTQWASIKTTLDKVESIFSEQDIEAARKLAKTIGLLSIFAPASAELSRSFMVTYAQRSLGIAEAEDVLRLLEKHKLIRYVAHKKSYIVFEGTDLDIELAIDEAGQLVDQVTDVAKRLSEYFTFPYIAAKEVSFEKGTPRIFEVKVTNDVLLDEPQGEVDGFINLIFSDSLTPVKLQQIVGERRDAILYGIYRKSGEIKRLIREIEKVKRVRELNLNDKIAVRELNSILDHQIKLLNHYVLDSIYQNDGNIIWYCAGEPIFRIEGRRNFNRYLSRIARNVYHGTPNFRSELVNRSKLSSAIATAKKGFIRALFEKWQWDDLGFDPKKFPPEKTIYLSLLKATGMHIWSDGGYVLQPPSNESFATLWAACEDFLHRSQEGALRISELMLELQRKPFKLKQGFIDFWVPIFLFVKRHDFALYGEQGRYIPEFTTEIIDLFTKNPKQYAVKAFTLEVEKLTLLNEYRELLQLGQADRTSNESFIESIKPFLSFYRQLPQYTRKTRKLSHTALHLRDAIARSTDPEVAFFESFPSALGFNNQELQQSATVRETYIQALQETITQLRTAYSALLQRLENFIATNVAGTQPVFEQYQKALKRRFKSLATHHLTTEQKAFHGRLKSALDDRDAWLNSVAGSLLQKDLKDFDDHDELLFQDHFKHRVSELDNLCDLTKIVIDPDREEVFRLGISRIGAQEQALIIRRPKVQSSDSLAIEEKIRSLLGSDKEHSLAILARLIQEQLQNEE